MGHGPDVATWASVCDSGLAGSGGTRRRHEWCPCRGRGRDPPILGHALFLDLGPLKAPGHAGVCVLVRDLWGKVDVRVHGEYEKEVGVDGNVGGTEFRVHALSPSPRGGLRALWCHRRCVSCLRQKSCWRCHYASVGRGAWNLNWSLGLGRRLMNSLNARLSR